MNIPNPSPLLKQFYTITEKLERLEKDFQEVRREVSALRNDCSSLGRDVAVLKITLESTEKVFEAKMNAVVRETMADLRIQYAEQQAEKRLPLPAKSDSES